MKKLFTLTFFTVIFSFSLFSQEIRELTEGVIYSELGKNISFTSEKYTLPSGVKNGVEKAAAQKFHSDFLYIYKISSGNKIISYGFLDNVPGKSLPITFFVLLTTDGKVISSHIIKYREAYGGAVSERGWNEKFKNRDASSDFTVGKSIDGISGATISVNSVTKGIKKILLLFNEINSSL